MGNSCTRSETQVILSEQRPRDHRDTGERGRWSAPDVIESVDLDMLVNAPSPPPQRRRNSRGKSKSEKSRFHWTSGNNNNNNNQAIDLDTAIEADASNGSKKGFGRNNSRQAPRGRPNLRQQKSTMDDDKMVYHSYDDPGYMGADHNIELMHFDSDLILGSPVYSPSVIHARWGEPVDDPDEESVCTEFRPNPFKLGFCVNCQKQHEVTTTGDVVSEKNYKKIARPVVSKTAANALDNPAAVENAPSPKRESDVDLTALLRQRRDILLKLNKLDQEKAKTNALISSSTKSTIDPPSRHTMMYLSDSGNQTSLANLRRMTSNGRSTTSGPQSYVLNRGSSVALSPRATSLRGISKSVSMGSRFVDDEEPAQHDWL